MYPVIDTWDPIDKYIELDEGQSTTFTCIYTASTNSSVTITTWKFYEMSLQINSSHYTDITKYDSSLVISILKLSNVTTNDTGNYTCQCGYNPSVINVNSDVNKINSNTVTFSLKVIAPQGGH